MSIHLIRDLETLHAHLLSMCDMVQDYIHRAVEELSSPDRDRARRLIEWDREIDAWDVRIEDECLKILALHQPVAIDLRRIATVLKITGELERVADLGSNLAERAIGLMDGPLISVPERLKHMSQIALDMLQRSITAYVQLDSKTARRICAEDAVVDRLNREIIEELIQTMKESPERIDSGMHLFSASRYIERVADHATNIAEDVVYLVEGIIIRHGAHE